MKRFATILILTLFTLVSFAKVNGKNWIRLSKPKKVKILEFGVLGGASWYYGDLCDNFYTLRFIKSAEGIYTRYQFNYHFGIRASINKGYLWADDKYSTDINRRIRNLRFESTLSEGNIIAEYNFNGLRTCPYFDYTPYVFAGLGIFHFNPTTTYNGQTIRLSTLNTEGQGIASLPERKPYLLTQVSIPFGGGFKIAVAHHFIIGIELGWRKTFTDYIDDVSTGYVNPALLASNKGSLAGVVSDLSNNQILSHDQTFDKRGNPNAKDWYMIAGITVGYVIKSNCPPRYSPSKRKHPKRLYCPSISKPR
ncbi:MAG: hypothetical protein RJA07_581 [Bacteroidota bacterium]|jgi:hypothetical protein